MIIRQAVILAGGQGKRLLPYTENYPKPLHPVLGKPFIEHLLDLVNSNGITDVIILTGYLENKIRNYLGDGSNIGLNIKYSYLPLYDESGEEIQTGTRVKNAFDLLDEHFLLLYGDNYWPMNLSRMVDHFENMNTLGMVTVYNNKFNLAEYGDKNNILVTENSLVQEYDNTWKNPNMKNTDIGFFIFKKDAINQIPSGNSHLANDFLKILIAQKQLAAYRTDQRYYFITSESTANDAELFLTPKKIVFLDRDGVINKKPPEHDYVKNWNEFEFLPGAIEGIKTLNNAGYKVFVVTNQRGIARGIFGEKDLEKIHQKMLLELNKSGAYIEKIYYCPHNDGVCDCRKPQPGLLIRASNDYHINLTKTILIGDDEKDIAAGNAVGCRTFLLKNNMNLLDMARLIANK